MELLTFGLLSFFLSTIHFSSLENRCIKLLAVERPLVEIENRNSILGAPTLNFLEFKITGFRRTFAHFIKN